MTLIARSEGLERAYKDGSVTALGRQLPVAKVVTFLVHQPAKLTQMARVGQKRTLPFVLVDREKERVQNLIL